MTRNQILDNVITGIMSISLPKDGKTVGIGKFKIEIQNAYRLARNVQNSYTLNDMRKAYKEFSEYINTINK